MKTTTQRFIKPDDKLLYARVLDRLFLCAKHKSDTFTDFLDPRSSGLFLDAARADIKEMHYNAIEPVCFGGFMSAERRMIGFLVADNIDEQTPHADIFPITPLCVTYNRKFAKPPSHRDYLGSLIGLGIDRSKLGDIVIKDTEDCGALIFVHTELSDYIRANLETVGRVHVDISEAHDMAASLDEAIAGNGKEMRFTAGSMRLDAVVGAVFHLSRSNAQKLVSSETVFVNWQPITASDHRIKENDTITVRKRGRVCITDIGTTSRGRVAIQAVVYQ